MPAFSRQVQKGSTDVSVVVRVQNQISFVPQVSMSEATSGLYAKYWREGAGNWVSFAPAAVSFLSSDHTDGGFEAIADGYYRLDVPDAAFATGATGVLVSVGATGMISDGAYVELVDFNPVTNDTQSTPQKY